MATRQLKPTVIDETTAVHLAELFSAFGDASRVRLISALTLREMNVTALAEATGLSALAMSH